MNLQSKIQTILLKGGFYTINLKNFFFFLGAASFFLVSNRCVSV